jgi:hypothetical protein
MFEIDSPFTMVAVIMICVTIMSVYKNRSRKSDSEEPLVTEQELDALRREVKDLRQRVHTLEKLATDPEEKLKREFASL